MLHKFIIFDLFKPISCFSSGIEKRKSLLPIRILRALSYIKSSKSDFDSDRTLQSVKAIALKNLLVEGPPSIMDSPKVMPIASVPK